MVKIKNVLINICQNHRDYIRDLLFRCEEKKIPREK